MSHTTRLGANWIAIHNGDFSGDVRVCRLDDKGLIAAEIEAPFGVFVNLVAAHVVNERIARLEQMSGCEILGVDPGFAID
jgi:hypothetical protein